MNSKRLFPALVLVCSLALSGTACSSQHHSEDSSTRKAGTSAPTGTPSATESKQTIQRLIAVTWCDPQQNSGYRTVQKFDLSGARVGNPAYFNVTPMTGLVGATEAGCNSGITGAEMNSAFVSGGTYDTIVTTKFVNGSTHEGFEPSVSTVPEITSDGGAPDPTPNNFFDLTGIPEDSLQKVTDLPGAMGPHKKVYFVRTTEHISDDPTYQLMKGDANTPAKPIRTLTDPGVVFFPPNATEPYISSHDNTTARATYRVGGGYGCEGVDNGLRCGTQAQLAANKGTFYKVTKDTDDTPIGDVLQPFDVGPGSQILATTQEGIYDITASGSNAKAKRLVSATGNYVGDALLIGDTIMFVAGDDNGDQSLYTVSLTDGKDPKKVYPFPHGSTGDVNLLGISSNAS